MKSNIYIPKKIKVGFNTRSDTYTKKLGYVIYHDGKVWRKEASWESWREKYIDEAEYDRQKNESFLNTRKSLEERYVQLSKSKDDWSKKEFNKYTDIDHYLKDCKADKIERYDFRIYNQSKDKSIQPVEFENTPQEGFVLNKKAGGYSTGWNHRQTYCRIYDPRGFEFEITIPNLLYILENSTSTKGKGLEGKFIYGWEGKDLILVPEDSPEYKDMIEFTSLQSMKLDKKDLKIGGIYLNSKNEKVTYLCDAPVFDYYGVTTGENNMWFYNESESYRMTENLASASSLKKYIGDCEDLTPLIKELHKNEHFNPKKGKKIRTYEELTAKEVDKEVRDSNAKYSYTDYPAELFTEAKTKGKYKTVYVNKNSKSYNPLERGKFYLQRNAYDSSSVSDNFNSAEELIKEYKLFKLVNKPYNG